MRVARLLLGVAVVTGFGMNAAHAAGGTQTIDVQVRGATMAYCTFTNDTVNEQGQFPGEVEIARSGKDLQADCKGEDDKRVTFVVPANIEKPNALSGLTNAILPATAYDPATGGVYAYPKTVTVDFREMAENANVIDDTVAPAAGMTPQAQMQSPVGMQPIVETQNSAVITAAATGSEIKTLTATQASASSKMQPVASPEDKMGLEPGKVKAAERAKVEARNKAKAEAAAAKRRAAEEAAAAKAAEEAAAAAAAAPAVTPVAEPAAVAPVAADPAVPATTTETAPAATAPVPSTDAPPAEPVTSPATTTEPATTAPSAAPSEAAPSTTTGAPTPITPEAGANTEMDKYLQGQ